MCVDVVRGLSVGRNQDCVAACCIILRYKLHYLYRGVIGTYMYGIIQWSVGRNQDCIPACCIILRYVTLFISGDDRYYMYGINQWSPGSIQGVRVLPVV